MSGSLLIAVLLSLLSAVAYAISAVTQERLATAPGTSAPLTSPLTSPQWWLTIGLNTGGGVLHLVALAYGSLAVVQPLGTLTLVVALPLGAGLVGRRVTGREWRGAAATIAGLVGLLVALDTGLPSEALNNPEILVMSGLTAVAISALILNRRTQTAAITASFRGLRLAVASGIAFAVSSVLTQTVILRTTSDTGSHLGDPVLVGAAVGVIALSVAALLLSQASYRFGLGAQLATLSLVNPAVSAGIGILLLGQGVSLSMYSAAGAILAAGLAASGVVLLASPDDVAARQASLSSLREVDQQLP